MSAPRNKIRVGVLRGGPSGEYDMSLLTGAHILRSLPEKYHPQDILISKSGAWHIDGLERSPEKILNRIDVAFNALHGNFGDAGNVQQLLEHHRKPYTGSGIAGSTLGQNKLHARRVFSRIGFKSPQHFVLRSGEDTDENINFIFSSLSAPMIVKPAAAGSSRGVSLVRDPASLLSAVRSALELSSGAIVEEFIEGREATCGVIEGYRGLNHYSLPPVEILHDSQFYDYDAKRGGTARIQYPGGFTKDESEEIQRQAAAAHEALGLRHYSRSDFIISKNGIYILETNALPPLMPHSAFSKSLDVVGCTMPEFLDHVLALAHKRI